MADPQASGSQLLHLTQHPDPRRVTLVKELKVIPASTRITSLPSLRNQGTRNAGNSHALPVFPIPRMTSTLSTSLKLHPHTFFINFIRIYRKRQVVGPEDPLTVPTIVNLVPLSHQTESLIPKPTVTSATRSFATNIFLKLTRPISMESIRIFRHQTAPTLPIRKDLRK